MRLRTPMPYLVDPTWDADRIDWEVRMVAENLDLEVKRYARLKAEAKSQERKYVEQRAALEARLSELKTSI